MRRLVANGISPDDLAHLWGYSDRKSLSRAVNRDPELKALIAEAKNVSNAALVESAIKSACGYTVETERIKYTAKVDGKKEPEWIPVEKQVIRDWQRPDATLLRFLLVCFMPDAFAEGRLLQKEKDRLLFEDKSTPSADSIEKLAGKLLDLASEYREKTKRIEAAVIDGPKDVETRVGGSTDATPLTATVVEAKDAETSNSGV